MRSGITAWLLAALLAAALAPSSFAQEEEEKKNKTSPAQLAREGRRLSQQDAEKLEEKLETNPENLAARTRLLGYYFAKAVRISGPAAPIKARRGHIFLRIGLAATIEDRRRHIFWLIQNHPETKIAGLVEATIGPARHQLGDTDGYEQAKKLWLQQVESKKENIAVLGNAATFFQLPDKEIAEGILKRAQAVYPDNFWSGRLGYLYALGILGVNGLNPNGIPTSVDPAEMEGRFAKKAREELTKSSNATVLGTAGGILNRYGIMLRGMKRIESDYSPLAEELLKKAGALEPNNPRWQQSLAQLYKWGSMASESPEEKAVSAKKALEQLEKSAMVLVGTTMRLHALPDLAKAAFEAGEMKKANAYASELLEMGSQRKDSSMYGTAVHHGNLILGRIVLREGGTEKAKAFLLRAGQTPGGGTLTSFGPNMALAKELLERGEKETVIEYLELCKKFWGYKRDLLERWIETVKSGGIHKFWANLIY